MHRLSLLAALLHPDQLRHALRPPRTGGPTTAQLVDGAWRCGLSVALALAVAALTGHHDLAGFAALGALASLYGRTEAAAWRVRLQALAGAALTGTIVVMTALGAAGAPAVVELAALVLLAAGATAGTAALRTGPPGATILVFAAGAGTAAASGTGDVVARGVAALGGAAVAWLVGNGVAVVRRTTRSQGATAAAAPRLRDVVRAGASGTAGPVAVLAPTVLVGVAAAVAAGVATVAGWGHPAWAAMGATAVLQGAHVRHMGVRALQRAAGTACGAALALPLLGAELPFWAVAVLVVALQTVTELVVARHYGAAMLAITPMALLMTSIGGVGDPTALAVDRALDTALGAVAALVVAVAAARPEHPVVAPTGSSPAASRTPEAAADRLC